jgi:hypothetical protein
MSSIRDIRYKKEEGGKKFSKRCKRNFFIIIKKSKIKKEEVINFSFF